MENKPLSSYLADIEALAAKVDQEAESTGDIPKPLLDELWAKRAELCDKVDAWINYLDGLAGEEAVLALKLKRAQEALKRCQARQLSMKNYAKYVLLTHPEIPLKGSEGKICLQKNPPALDISFERKDKVFYKAIDESFATFEPSLSPYLKQVTCFVVDTDHVKEDLAIGKVLNWAKIKQDFHVRIR